MHLCNRNGPVRAIIRYLEQFNLVGTRSDIHLSIHGRYITVLQPKILDALMHEIEQIKNWCVDMVSRRTDDTKGMGHRGRLVKTQADTWHVRQLRSKIWGFGGWREMGMLDLMANGTNSTELSIGDMIGMETVSLRLKHFAGAASLLAADSEVSPGTTVTKGRREQGKRDKGDKKRPALG